MPMEPGLVILLAVKVGVILASTIQDLALSLLGALLGALVIATLLWPTAGTPATLVGWQ